MTPFDTVVVVDWSAADDTGLRERGDAIWIGLARGGVAQDPKYLRNRTVAEECLTKLIEAELVAGCRMLLGFDFPFGYPQGLAARISDSCDPRDLWNWFADELKSLPSGEGRFHLAAKINKTAFAGEEGPFWFNGLKRDIEGLPRKEPPVPPSGIAKLRLVERHAPGTFACWQMGGAGAVGSQAMTGMATLARLRRRFPDKVAVWPFEPWDAGPVVMAEVWPSLVMDAVARRMSEDNPPKKDSKGKPIKDAAQVVVLSEMIWRLNASGCLDEVFSAALDAAPNIVTEEGWILGVGPKANLLLDPRDAGAGWPDGSSVTRGTSTGSVEP